MRQRQADLGKGREKMKKHIKSYKVSTTKKGRLFMNGLISLIPTWFLSLLPVYVSQAFFQMILQRTHSVFLRQIENIWTEKKPYNL